MESLLRSGDTGRIIFFANTARMPAIYMLAAEHLMVSGKGWLRRMLPSCAAAGYVGGPDGPVARGGRCRERFCLSRCP